MTEKEKRLVKAACDHLALCDAAAFDLELPVSPPRSPEYMEKIKQLFARFDKTPKKSISRRAKIGLLIAAALLAALLTACAVFHEQIGNFILEWKADHIEVTATGKSTIETYYMPTDIPGGYEETDSFVSDVICKYVWMQGQDKIVFKQAALEGTVHFFDSEGPDTGTMTIAGREVIYNRKDGYFACIWEDGSYSYSLICPSSLPDEEIERIILSIAEYMPE